MDKPKKEIFRVRMCKVCVSIFLLLLLPIRIQQVLAQVTEEWVARYNGPANGADAARAIAIDSFGNVYVTGYGIGNGTYNDYVTVSYDPSGNQCWVARYNGPANYSDHAFAIAIDLSGNIYVTGESASSRYYYDYATISYDSAGNVRWVARYNSSISDTDIAQAIVTDSSGNVYVTGYSIGNGTYNDYLTVSYDPSGNQRWVVRYNGPGDYNDDATAIATDSSGNIYITGSSYGNGTSFDYATVSYDPSGNQRWVARYNGPANGDDVARSIATDLSGNVYVTGWSIRRGTERDYATVSYDPVGNERWVARYNGPANSEDSATAITTDSSGNIYVTGYSNGWRTYDDYATVSYDTLGNERWVTRYDGLANNIDAALAVATDSSGNIYVTGTSYGIGTNNDYVTVSYDSSGNERWVTRYDGPTSGGDGARSIATDLSGNVYVTGYSDGIGTNYDYATVKYSQAVRLPCEVPPDDGIPAEPSNDKMFIVSSTPFPTEPVVQQLQSQIEEVAPFVVTDESGFQRVLSAAARRAGVSAHALALGHKIVSLNNRIVKTAIRDEEIHLPASEFAFIESFFQYQAQAGSHCGSFRSPTPCPPWVGSGVYFSVKDEVIQHLLSLGYHQTARYATTGGVYGDDYTLVVIHPTCGTGPFRTQAIIRQQEDCWTYSTQGTEPNSEFRSYTWPHVWWVGYVFWWHRFYCN